MKTIKFFKLASGTCPVADFLDSLSAKQAQKMAWVMQLIQEMKDPPAQYFKKLVNTTEIWEIRAQFGSDIFRILGFLADELFIATNGFQKKSQKTPKSEISLAESRRQFYLNNKEYEV